MPCYADMRWFVNGFGKSLQTSQDKAEISTQKMCWLQNTGISHEASVKPMWLRFFVVANPLPHYKIYRIYHDKPALNKCSSPNTQMLKKLKKTRQYISIIY